MRKESLRGRIAVNKKIVEKIADDLEYEIGISRRQREKCISVIEKSISDYKLIQTTYIDYCQACGRDFHDGEIVYYAPIDNNIVCSKCAEEHRNKEIRIFATKG